MEVDHSEQQHSPPSWARRAAMLDIDLEATILVEQSSPRAASSSSPGPRPRRVWSLGEYRHVEAPSLPKTMRRASGTCWSVDQFLLNKQLYKSSRSKVYDATDLASGVRVALKLYRKSQMNALNRTQVEREINIQVHLDHPNIIKLYAAFEDARNVYLVQEFADGGDLFQKVQVKGTRVNEDVVQDLMATFLAMLEYLHGKGIIHRDIKPENILLTSSGVIKLADFGLAIDLNEERPVTRLGTLEYMAPEVLKNPDKTSPEQNKENTTFWYTPQVDIWAAGVLTFELLVGRAPFEQPSYLETFQSILHKEPVLPMWLSRHAKSFIKSALCKDALRRPSLYQLQRHPWLAYDQPDSRGQPLPPASWPAPVPVPMPVRPSAASPPPVPATSGWLDPTPTLAVGIGRLSPPPPEPAMDPNSRPQTPYHPISTAGLPGISAVHHSAAAAGPHAAIFAPTPSKSLPGLAAAAPIPDAPATTTPLPAAPPASVSDARAWPLVKTTSCPGNGALVIPGVTFPALSRSVTLDPRGAGSLAAALSSESKVPLAVPALRTAASMGPRRQQSGGGSSGWCIGFVQAMEAEDAEAAGAERLPGPPRRSSLAGALPPAPRAARPASPSPRSRTSLAVAGPLPATAGAFSPGTGAGASLAATLTLSSSPQSGDGDAERSSAPALTTTPRLLQRGGSGIAALSMSALSVTGTLPSPSPPSEDRSSAPAIPASPARRGSRCGGPAAAAMFAVLPAVAAPAEAERSSAPALVFASGGGRRNRGSSDQGTLAAAGNPFYRGPSPPLPENAPAPAAPVMPSTAGTPIRLLDRLSVSLRSFGRLHGFDAPTPPAVPAPPPSPAVPVPPPSPAPSPAPAPAAPGTVDRHAHRRPPLLSVKSKSNSCKQLDFGSVVSISPGTSSSPSLMLAASPSPPAAQSDATLLPSPTSVLLQQPPSPAPMSPSSSGTMINSLSDYVEVTGYVAPVRPFPQQRTAPPPVPHEVSTDATGRFEPRPHHPFYRGLRPVGEFTRELLKVAVAATHASPRAGPPSV